MQNLTKIGMGLITIIFLLKFSNSCAGQGIPGKKIDGPITILDTVKINIGDTIYLGQGTGQSKKFLFVFDQDWYAAPNGMAGKFLVLKAIKYSQSKQGDKYYGVAKLYALSDWGIDFEQGIIAGEIVAINKMRFDKKNQQQTIVIQNNSNVSVADELKKLKELLDQGIITQAEFDEQKKKLLAK